ncbi:MAG: NfeD family protein [Pseudomonadota bacterium]|jgi:membrane protein implicated in regulation of membrane protease activity
MILDALVFWHWWTLGALLLILELLVPGMYFIWMAEAALVTGAMLWLFPALSWEIQVLVFSILSLASIFVVEKLIARKPIVSDRPLLNRRAAQYIGRTLTLQQPIVGGMGKVRVDDSIWRVSGEDCPAGARVRVNDVDGVILKVERID